MTPRCLLLSLLLAILCAASPLRAENTGGIGAGSLAPFRTLPSDPPPAEITRNSHYWVSNEVRLDLFHDALQKRGGVYLGVGTDQNYLMAAWAQSELVILMDFDQKIVDLHRVYDLLFRNASSKEAFVGYWEEEASEEVRNLIKAAHPEKSSQRPLLEAHRSARRFVARRLKKLIKHMEQAALPTFLTDDQQYAHVRQLFLDNKVFMVAGDLTASRAMQGIGKATAAAELKVRVLYLSNAEQYFDNGEAFRSNIVNLPTDDKSIVVRTSASRALSRIAKDHYHYNVQTGESFKLFLADDKTRSTADMLKQAPPSEIYGFSFMDGPPAETKDAVRERASVRRRADRKLAERLLAEEEAKAAKSEERAEKRRLRHEKSAERKLAREEKRAQKQRLRAETREERKPASEER